MSSIVRKDTSIWTLIAQLAAIVGGDSFQLVDHWDADLFAMGIAGVSNNRRLVYVSTFGKPPGFLAYDCEEPDADLVGQSVAKSELADFPEFLRVVERHLGLAPRGHAS
jgi:hypothetical protein